MGCVNMNNGARPPRALVVNEPRTYDAVVAEAAPDVDYPTLSIAAILDAQYGRQPPPQRKLDLYDLSDSGQHGMDQLMGQFHHIVMTRAMQLSTYRGGRTVDERDLARAIMTCPDIMPRAFVDSPPRPALEPHGSLSLPQR